MKITFYGTGASEGVPAVFCTCKNCQKARKRGGKNIRTRTSAQIDDHMLVDFSMDSYAHQIYQNLDLASIRYLLVTHSHEDHFYVRDLLAAEKARAILPEGWHLTGYGNSKVCSIWRKAAQQGNAASVHMPRISFTELEQFVPVSIGPYRVTPLLARHDPAEDCYLYLIERSGKRLLYAHDTYLFPDSTWKALKGGYLDCVVLDCTSTTFPDIYTPYHMSFHDNILTKARMIKENMADEKTIFVATHFVHAFQPLHEELTAIFQEQGFIPAFDGMQLEI